MSSNNDVKMQRHLHQDLGFNQETKKLSKNLSLLIFKRY